MVCQRCGNLLIGNSLSGVCQYCGNAAQSEPRAAPLRGDGIPWEAPAAGSNPVVALAQAFKSSFLTPGLFFKKIDESPRIAPALFYGLVMGSIGTLMLFFWQAILPDPFSLIFPDSDYFGGASKGITSGSLMFTPAVLLLKLFFSTVILHGMLLITRSKKKPFRATLKTVCYAEGSILFQIVPVVGPLAALVAWFYLIIRGLSAAHSISKGRVVMAIVVPFMAFFFLCIVLGIILGLMIAFSGGAQAGIFSQLLNR